MVEYMTTIFIYFDIVTIILFVCDIHSSLKDTLWSLKQKIPHELKA